MGSLNSVMLIGRLTADPELRSTRDGVTVCCFRLRIEETRIDSMGQEGKKTNFVDVEAWGRLGDICGRYLNRGREVFVAGRFESLPKRRKASIVVRAAQVQFLGESKP